MMIRNLPLAGTTCALWLMLLAYGAEGFAANYYVAKAGNNSNPGTLEQPWQTISKANSTLEAGDTVYIRAGTYNEVIDSNNSGKAGSGITYKNYANEQVTVTGSSSGTSAVTISGGDSYITVEGLDIKLSDTVAEGKNILIYGSYSEIRNCRIVNTGNPVTQNQNGIKQLGIYIYGGHHNVIEGNHVEGMSGGGIKLQKTPRFNVIRNNTIVNSYGDAIRIDSGKGTLMGNLIENNRLGGSLTSDGVQFNADFDLPEAERELDTGNRGTIIRNNWIFDNAENGIDLKGTSNIVIEGNYIFGNIGDNDGQVTDIPDRGTGGGIYKGSHTSSRDVIIRNNIIYDNSGGTSLLEHYLIYNNTIIANNRDYTGPNSSYSTNGEPVFTNIAGSSSTRAAVKNNIIGEAASAELHVSAGTNVEINNNLYFNSTGVIFAVGQSPWIALNYNQWTDLLETKPNSIGDDNNSKLANPRFVNAPARPVGSPDSFNFRLAADSPAIDAGINLTSTVGSGTGNRIVLNDSGYFYDGFGVTEGDTIRIGAKEPVRISAVDYATNTITVDRSISWADKEPVNLQYSGTAPDIGAFESASQAITETPPSVPSGLQIMISPM